MIEEFSRLGGVVRNIAPGENGLIAVDPSEPVLVRIPPQLLVRPQDITVANGRIFLAKSADIPEPARSFFERYANAFGLSAARKAEIFSFVSALAALPADVRDVLATDFGFGGLLNGDTDRGIRNHFVAARQIAWSRDRAIAPVIELARYGLSGLRPERGSNLQVNGYVKKEVFVRFAPQDPFSAFRLFGRAVPEPAACSLAMTIGLDQYQLDIGRKLSEGAMRGKDRVPNISMDGQKISMSYLLLGHEQSPALPRTIFRALLSEVGIDHPDETFDSIVRFNALRFITLLQTMEPYEADMISTLRTMVRYQLQAMNHRIGGRKLTPARTV